MMSIYFPDVFSPVSYWKAVEKRVPQLTPEERRIFFKHGSEIIIVRWDDENSHMPTHYMNQDCPGPITMNERDWTEIGELELRRDPKIFDRNKFKRACETVQEIRDHQGWRVGLVKWVPGNMADTSLGIKIDPSVTLPAFLQAS